MGGVVLFLWASMTVNGRLAVRDSREYEMPEIASTWGVSETPLEDRISYKEGDKRNIDDYVIYFSDNSVSRYLVQGAIREYFSDFAAKYFKGDENVLEIGSGDAFLIRNWPEFKGKWLMTDIELFHLEEAQKLYPQGNYEVADAHNLQYKSKSFSVYAGSCVLDIVHLEEALKEAYRVLEDDGLLFHFIDIGPNYMQVGEELGERMGIIPRMMGPERVIMHPGVGKVFTIPPEKQDAYEKEINAIEDIEDYNERLEAEHRVDNKYYVEVDLHEEFRKNIVYFLKKCGFVDVESGTHVETYKGPRTELQKQIKGEPFVYYRDGDGGRYFRNSSMYYFHKLNLIGMFNPIPFYHGLLYRSIKKINPQLAQKIEPEFLEVNTVHYVVARKKSLILQNPPNHHNTYRLIPLDPLFLLEQLDKKTIPNLPPPLLIY